MRFIYPHTNISQIVLCLLMYTNAYIFVYEEHKLREYFFCCNHPVSNIKSVCEAYNLHLWIKWHTCIQ